MRDTNLTSSTYAPTGLDDSRRFPVL